MEFFKILNNVELKGGSKNGAKYYIFLAPQKILTKPQLLMQSQKYSQKVYSRTGTRFIFFYISIIVVLTGVNEWSFLWCTRILNFKKNLDIGQKPYILTWISLPVGTNGEPLVAIGKFPNVIGKLMIGETLALSGEEITNAMIGNDILPIYWLSLVNWLCKALDQIGNEW